MALQDLWDDVISSCGHHPFTYHVTITYLWLVFVYTAWGGVFAFFDLTLSPKQLRKYKTQPGTNEPMNKNKFLGMMAQVVFNGTIMAVPTVYGLYRLREWIYGVDMTIPALPALSTMVWQIVLCMLIEEILFFYVHWALHHRLVYKRFHKMHHEWTAPIAYAAAYAHPVEHLFSNMLSPAIPTVLLNMHVSTSLIWFTFVIVMTQIHHCGYHFPILASPEFHDFHHLKFDTNFSTAGFMDALHGTDKKWQNHVASLRHFTLFGTESARELFPDTKSE
jgi:sterol desaturase/sphingolipid hydroxylase (fatty acid hydroxylase superfamily)